MVNRVRYRLLCIDVGNTSVSLGLFDGGKLKVHTSCESYSIPLINRSMAKIVGSFPVDYYVVSSVVPKISHFIKSRLGERAWFVGRELKVPMKHGYSNPRKLGMDRLVNAYGGVNFYGPPLLILDFGTALTCDYVSQQGIFEGGEIIPGPEVAWKALVERAVLLPEAPFPFHRKNAPLVGKDTVSGMEAGILHGYGALADGLIAKFQRRYGRGIKAIATGGLSPLIYRYTNNIDVLDPFLTLKSLAELFQKQKS